MSKQIDPREVLVEERERGGKSYRHIEIADDAGRVEFTVNVFDDGRIALGSTEVSFTVERLHRHGTGSSLELGRNPIRVSTTVDS